MVQYFIVSITHDLSPWTLTFPPLPTSWSVWATSSPVLFSLVTDKDPQGQNVSLQLTPCYMIAHNVPIQINVHNSIVYYT